VFLNCLLPQSGDSRLWRHVLKFSVAKDSQFYGMELSMCLQNPSPQYGNRSSYQNVMLFQLTRLWKMSANWVTNKFSSKFIQ